MIDIRKETAGLSDRTRAFSVEGAIVDVHFLGDTAVFVMWDEGALGNPMPNLFITPYTPAVSVSATMNHFAALRATEDMLGLGGSGYLGESATDVHAG